MEQPGTESQAPAIRRWREVWQLPLLVAAAVMLVGGVGYLISKKPKVDVEGTLTKAESMLSEDKFGDTLDYLNANVLPHLGRADVTPEMQAKFHQLVARSLYLEQQRRGLDVSANHENVIGEYREAEKLGATLSPSDQYYRADTLAMLGKLDEAIESMRKVEGIKPAQRFSLYRRLIEASMKNKGAVAVSAELLAAMLSEPEIPREDRLWATARQAELFIDEGKPGEAITRLLRALPRLGAGDGEGMGELFLLLGEAYLATGATGDAAKQADRAAELMNPSSNDYARVLVMQARVDEVMGSDEASHERARDRYAEVIERYGGSPAVLDARQGLAESEAALGNTKESIEAYTELVKELIEGRSSREVTRDGVTGSLLSRFNERFAAGELEDALHYVRLAESMYKADEAPPDVLRAIGDASLALGQEKLPAEDPDGVRPPIEDSSVLADVQRNLMDAGAAYRAHANRVILTSNEDYAKSLWSAGIAYDLAGDRESAIAAFREFVDGFPSDARQPEAKFRLARAHQARGELEQAAALYRDLIDAGAASGDARSGPWGDASYVPLAETLLMDNDPSNDPTAEQLLLSVVDGKVGGQGTARFREALLLLGGHYHDTGNHAAAIQRLTEFTRRFPDSPRLPVAQYKLADSLRNSALAIDEDLRQRANSGAEARELQAARRDRLTSALELFGKVRASLEEKPAARRSAIEELCLRNSYFYLGDCAFDLGQYDPKMYDQAVVHYEAAKDRYKGEPASMVAMIQVVHVYLKRGDSARAMTANTRARAFYESLPETVWDDPSLPISRRDWERWLDATATLNRQASAGGQEGP